MSRGQNSSTSSSMSSSVAGTGLAARRGELAAAINLNRAACDAAALRAALGDAAARSETESALARSALLAAEADALDRAIAADAAAGEAAAARAAAIQRRRAAEVILAQLGERLRVAAEVERLARRLCERMERLAGLGVAIDEAIDGKLGAAQLDGEIPERRFQAPLGVAAIGGRLAEFMSGLGLDAFLPLPRPETRSPIDALRAAEAAGQEPYRRLCQRLVAEEAP